MTLNLAGPFFRPIFFEIPFALAEFEITSRLWRKLSQWLQGDAFRRNRCVYFFDTRGVMKKILFLNLHEIKPSNINPLVGFLSCWTLTTCPPQFETSGPDEAGTGTALRRDGVTHWELGYVGQMLDFELGDGEWSHEPLWDLLGIVGCIRDIGSHLRVPYSCRMIHDDSYTFAKKDLQLKRCADEHLQDCTTSKLSDSRICGNASKLRYIFE